MSLTVFLLVRQVEAFDYPFREVCRSAYGIADEFVFLAAPSEDGTEAWMEEIRREFGKAKVLREDWWDGAGCLERAVNRCIEAVKTSHYLWLPADEALHERESPMLRAEADAGADLVTVGHTHFWGGFDRVFTRGTTCHWAPMLGKRARYPQLRCANAGADGLGLPGGSIYPFAHVNLAGQVKLYHYGYVRRTEALVSKNRDLMTAIGEATDPRWDEKPDWESMLPDRLTSLFGGTHPRVMAEWIEERRPLFRNCYVGQDRG